MSDVWDEMEHSIHGGHRNLEAQKLAIARGRELEAEHDQLASEAARLRGALRDGIAPMERVQKEIALCRDWYKTLSLAVRMTPSLGDHSIEPLRTALSTPPTEATARVMGLVSALEWYSKKQTYEPTYNEADGSAHPDVLADGGQTASAALAAWRGEKGGG